MLKELHLTEGRNNGLKTVNGCQKIKIARQINKLKVIEAAEKLVIFQPTLSEWEGERKSPYKDKLENLRRYHSFSIRTH